MIFLDLRPYFFGFCFGAYKVCSRSAANSKSAFLRTQEMRWPGEQILPMVFPVGATISTAAAAELLGMTTTRVHQLERDCKLSCERNSKGTKQFQLADVLHLAKTLQGPEDNTSALPVGHEMNESATALPVDHELHESPACPAESEPGARTTDPAFPGNCDPHENAPYPTQSRTDRICDALAGACERVGATAEEERTIAPQVWRELDQLAALKDAEKFAESRVAELLGRDGPPHGEQTPRAEPTPHAEPTYAEAE